jgi:pimeloyl-ACP methyl ester carboxylesterase
MRTYLYPLFLWLGTLLISSSAFADVAVFVHGYQSTGNIWREKGIIPLLVSHGWNDAGTYFPEPDKVVHYGPEIKGNSLVTVELPSEAPIEIQAGLLLLYLKDIVARHPEQSLRLIGHSAGGIVARLVLVNDSSLPVKQLITIATPHLGSPLAEMAETVANTPIRILAPLVGFDNPKRSKHLYSQLGREKENYFLFWLNRQPHPDIDYAAIVRADGSLLKGDVVVPSYSQAMSGVPAIGQKARLILTPGNHSLKFADGQLILPLIE